jgi:hypothetical protein
MRLALSVGRIDVDQMFAEMTAQQALEWLEYSQSEPFGAMGMDYRMAYMLTLYFNSHQSKDKSPFTVEEFLPGWAKTQKKQTVKEQLNIAKMYAAAGIGRITHA